MTVQKLLASPIVVCCLLSIHTVENRLSPSLSVSGSGSGSDGGGTPVSENRILEISAGRSAGPSVRIPLQEPLTRFFTATTRAGSAPSNVIDLLGTPAGEGRICYAQVRLDADPAIS